MARNRPAIAWKLRIIVLFTILGHHSGESMGINWIDKISLTRNPLSIASTYNIDTKHSLHFLLKEQQVPVASFLAWVLRDTELAS